LHLGQEAVERLVILREAIGQEMGLTPLDSDREFAPGDDHDAQLITRELRLSHAPDRIVVGEADGGEPDLMGPTDDLRWRQGAVGGGRMKVKIRESLGQRRYPSSGVVHDG
jgi:hypothetical protein